MNWINNVVRPKIRSILRKKEMPDNLWVKCPETGQMIYYKDLEANQFVVPGSNYHMRVAAAARLKGLFDGLVPEIKRRLQVIEDLLANILGQMGGKHLRARFACDATLPRVT